MKKLFILCCIFLIGCTSFTRKNDLSLTTIDDGNAMTALATIYNEKGEVQEQYITFSRSWSKELLDVAKSAALFTPAAAVRRPDRNYTNMSGGNSSATGGNGMGTGGSGTGGTVNTDIRSSSESSSSAGALISQ